MKQVIKVILLALKKPDSWQFYASFLLTEIHACYGPHFFEHLKVCSSRAYEPLGFVDSLALFFFQKRSGSF